MSDDEDSPDPACPGCDGSSVDPPNGGHRCLDCGRRWYVAPTGKEVYSIRVWWATTTAHAALLTGLFLLIPYGVIRGEPLGALFAALLAVEMLYLRRQDLSVLLSRLLDPDSEP